MKMKKGQTRDRVAVRIALLITLARLGIAILDNELQLGVIHIRSCAA